MKDKILKLLKCKFLFTLPSKDGYLIYDCETLQPNEFVLKNKIHLFTCKMGKNIYILFLNHLKYFLNKDLTLLQSYIIIYQLC